MTGRSTTEGTGSDSFQMVTGKSSQNSLINLRGFLIITTPGTGLEGEEEVNACPSAAWSVLQQEIRLDWLLCNWEEALAWILIYSIRPGFGWTHRGKVTMLECKYENVSHCQFLDELLSLWHFTAADRPPQMNRIISSSLRKSLSMWQHRGKREPRPSLTNICQLLKSWYCLRKFK